MNAESARYILATGAHDVERLRLLQEAYGPQSQALFHRAGLCEGLSIVEIGCGSGNTACWLAGQVGESGSVVGVDRSAEQIEQARRQAKARGIRNVSFVVADACETQLPAGSFDMAYCRLVLMHLAEPAAGLRAMRELVRSGGRVLCEEMDLTRWVCEPPSSRIERLFELNVALGELHGGHFRLGTSLPHVFQKVGFPAPQVSANFPFTLSGETKRLIGLSFLEFASELVREGLATQVEVDAIAAEAMRLADDASTLFGFPLVVQVWAAR